MAGLSLCTVLVFACELGGLPSIMVALILSVTLSGNALIFKAFFQIVASRDGIQCLSFGV